MKASILTLALVGLTTAQLFPNQSPLNHSCVIQKHALSCSKQAQDPSLDSCCTEVYGGLLVSTQCECDSRYPRWSVKIARPASMPLQAAKLGEHYDPSCTELTISQFGAPTPAWNLKDNCFHPATGVFTGCGPTFAMAVTPNTAI